MRRTLAVVQGLPSAGRRVRAQPLKAIARGLRTLPPRVRQALGTALVVASTRRGPGAAIRVIGETLRGRRDQALADAEEQAARPSTSTSTRLALARGALAVDDTPAAGRILATLGPAEQLAPGALALRADVAYRSGRYADALEHARLARAAGVGSPALPAIERRSASELLVLEPGWRPSLGVVRSRTARTPGRVLHLVTNSLPYRQSGYTVRTQSIARAQRECGLEPHVATQAGFPANEGVRAARREDVIDGIPYHRLDPDFDRWRGPDATIERTAQEADRLIGRLGPAVLHAASHFQNAQTAFALRDKHDLPVLYEVRGFLEDSWASRQDDTDESPHDADWYRRAKAAETAAITSADLVVTLSETMRSDILARGADPERIHVIPNAVDIAQFTPVERDAELAARVGLPEGATAIGYVSTFAKYEGIEYLIEAAAILRDRGRPTRVLLVGDGPHREALERRVRELELDDGSVTFAGRVPHDEVRRWYSLIDVFVVPRTADRVSQLVTPLKPYEAMALERALVVSGVDALREMVVEGETGLVFEPENPTSLADTLEPLLDDAEARLALGQAARRWVAANRTWAQNGARYLELYRQLGAV